jgi:hypothetical protein
MDIQIYQEYWSAWFPYLISFTLVFLFFLVCFSYFIWRQLKAIHSGHFASTWQVLWGKMQEEYLSAGRSFLRFLQIQSEANKAIQRSEWSQMFDEWKKHRMPSAQWYPEQLDQETDSQRRLYQITAMAREAYVHFDEAGVIVLHSRIPNLLEVFVAQYQDSIIACWEQGSYFFKDRVEERREELFECFSVLYVLAKHRRDLKPKLYPYYTLRDRWNLYRRGSTIAREAKKQRDKLISEVTH